MSEMEKIILHVQQLQRDVFVNVASAAHSSIQNGSPITGAPGQPVQTGNLKASWQLNFVSPSVAEISSNVEYAKPIEDGIGPHGALTLRSEVGGFHSVALTVAGLQAIVDAEVAELAR